MTGTLTAPVAKACKPPARDTFWRRFRRRLLYGVSCIAAEQFVDGAMWNDQARQAYLQALRGDRHALQAEGSAGQSKE